MKLQPGDGMGSLLWPPKAGRAGRRGSEGAPEAAEPLGSLFTSSAASCLPFGVKHTSLEAMEPMPCMHTWLQAAAVPWKMPGLTGDGPGLLAASGHGSLLRSHKGFFLLRKRSCCLGTGFSALAASLRGQKTSPHPSQVLQHLATGEMGSSLDKARSALLTVPSLPAPVS